MFHLYGLLVGVAVVLVWAVAERIDHRVNKLFPWVIVFGLVGARAYHVIDLWDYYHDSPAMILAVWNGGLGIWGGIFGGLFGLWLAAKFYKYGDRTTIVAAIFTGLPLGQAIGRLGNAVNGEFGEKVGILPWWASEMSLNLALFAIIFRMSKQNNPKYRVMIGTYLIGYGLIRFGLEYFRMRSWEISNLGVAQWVSIFSIVIGLLICQASARD